MSIAIDTGADSIVAVGICKLATLDYAIASGSDTLVLKAASGEEVKGADVLKYLLNIASPAKGTSDAEQKEAAEWAEKKTNIGELNKHLTTRVYIADGLTPTIADLRHFADLREQIIKQKAPQRNQFANVTRWFNHLQSLFTPEFSPVPIKLNYTPPKNDKEKKAEGKKADKEKKGGRRQPEAKVTGIGRLQMKVGRIVSIAVHETVPSLYVEQIDVGEAQPRTIVSKLAEKVPIEKMQNCLVVVGANLQPVELQGVVSQGLVFCASIGDDVEVLTPPSDAVVGEDLSIEGVPTDYTEEVKGKVFARAVKGLQTNDAAVACYKGTPLTTSKGPVTVASLKQADIK